MLKSFKFFSSLLIIFLILTPLYSEDKIDIWKNKNVEKKSDSEKNSLKEIQSNQKISNKPNSEVLNQTIEINDTLDKSSEANVFGIYDPEDFDFNLNMWSSTSSEEVKASLKRLKKIKLSKTSNEILENILLSFSYAPKGMEEKEFVSMKINWLFENNRSDLIESFLNQNKEFYGKSKVIQYLVDENIAQANIKQGCEKIKFMDNSLKDSYLEKFKIYCFVFDKKNSQAQLLLDLLREQNQSDKFFDDKINFLLGITNKTSQIINEKNLLNFYLSSITIENFEYTPSEKTKKSIWNYLNASNLIKLENYNDKEKIKNLELAANKGQIDKKIIFDIYKQFSFNLSNLINAKNVYSSLDDREARALIYQKYLLSEDYKSRVEYLFILEELFKKNDISNLYSEFLSDSLKEIGIENIPNNYKEISQKKMLTNKEATLGKIKYNDKTIHQSKILKFYLENENEKKVQKEINRIFKKIRKNKKYFYSAKDLALIESLIKDGFKVPNDLNYDELAQKIIIPSNLIELIEKNKNAFLTLKIVEIIGEDEPYQLDSETIFFITNLLNRMNLIKIRNKVLISALPQRI